MVPGSVADLDAVVAEAGRQAGEVDDILARLSDRAARWRPDETRWSTVGHVAHLGIINAAYLRPIEATVARALAAGGPRSDGPYRHPRIATWFAASMEPPPRRRMKTFRSMVADAKVAPEEAGSDFRRLQSRLADVMERSRGLDLGKIRFGSPFLALLRFSLGAGFEMLLAHNRRHIWLIHELQDTPGFPES